MGDDWAEDHHDVEVMDAGGRRLAKARLPEGVAGIARLHAMVGGLLGEDAEEEDAGQVAIGIETDRGPWVAALIAAGYTVYAINPLQASRYRERHGVSGAKSDPLTELRGGLGQVSGWMGVWVSRVADRDHRRGCAAGSVAAGGAAARVA